MTTVVVVGAGSAGCVVAAALSEDPALDVVLLEAGADRTPADRPDGLRSISYLDAVDDADAFWPDVEASFRAGEEPRPYLRGRGIGGSGSVNAMIALPGLPADYDRWRDEFGATGWGWSDVQPRLQALWSSLRQVGADELTPVDTALIDATKDLGLDPDVELWRDGADGAGRLWLFADEHGRRSSAEAFLDPARSRANLHVRGGSPVHAVEWSGTRAVGVRLQDGSVLAADHVVLCAGAFGSAEILLRSDAGRRGIGANLRDHAAVKADLTLHRPRDEDRSRPTIGTALRTSSPGRHGDLHLLPIHGRIWGMPAGATGALVLSLMTARSTGRLRIDGDGRRRIELDLLSDDRDVEAFLHGLATFRQVLESTAFTDLARYVLGSVHEVERLLDRAALASWLPGQLGQLLHAVGTCRMGSADDDDAVTDVDGALLGRQGVSVIDASIMPDVPAANTHLPTVMIASVLGARLRGRLGAG